MLSRGQCAAAQNVQVPFTDHVAFSTSPMSLKGLASTQHSCTRSRCVKVQAVQLQSNAAAFADIRSATKVKLITAADCELAVSIYPKFAYNASSGGGSGTVQQLGDNKLQITFDTEELLIPDLNWRTASVLGLPIPPPLNIAIRANKFEGVLDWTTGQLDMNFSADFDFTVGSLYRAPSLKVATTLTTEHSAGQIHKADGQRLNNGAVELVGVARVPKVDDAFLSTFLMLPTDALAVMNAQLEFN